MKQIINLNLLKTLIRETIEANMDKILYVDYNEYGMNFSVDPENDEGKTIEFDDGTPKSRKKTIHKIASLLKKYKEQGITKVKDSETDDVVDIDEYISDQLDMLNHD